MDKAFVYDFYGYLKEIESIPFDEDKEVLFLRGVSNYNFDMRPGIMFDNKKPESETYHSLIMEYPEEFDSKNHLSTLSKMQHYGATTRLIDFSTNILVAAFFASEQRPEMSGKVVVYKVKKNEILHHNSDRALMLACLPPLKEDVKDKIRQFCENHPGEITDEQIKGHPEMVKFLHEIRGEYPAFETAIIGEDILKCFFVQSNKDNQRMKTQCGYFAICGLDNERNARYLNSIAEKEIIITPQGKEKIMKTLKLMNVHTDTMYPDLERTAVYLRNKKLAWSEINK